MTEMGSYRNGRSECMNKQTNESIDLSLGILTCKHMGVAYILEAYLPSDSSLCSEENRVFPFNYAASSTASKIFSNVYTKQALSGET